MKRLLLMVALLVLATTQAATPMPSAAADDSDPPKVTITFFYGDGCPHCASEEVFLDALVGRYPELTVDAYEVW